MLRGRRRAEVGLPPSPSLPSAYILPSAAKRVSANLDAKAHAAMHCGSDFARNFQEETDAYALR